jgi:tetratricopeptide (TPR) repeat protein
MLAELLSVPVAAIRRWHRHGSLVACRRVRRLPYFDFAEVAVARHLAALHSAGCSLAVIDRKLRELHRSMPEVARPLSDPAIVVSGRQLILRRGDDLTEPGGQLLIDFDKPAEYDDRVDVFLSVDQVLQDEELHNAEKTGADEHGADETLSTVDQLHLEALKWEDQGELEQAAEVYRTLLMAAGPRAEVHFALADLLYRGGDLAGARERFYAAIELDEEYVEARANLGCVLAESGELELAVAAFQGALAFHSDYADVHYHLANALQRLQRLAEAELHWQTFLALAPESPWADLARDSLSSVQNEQENLEAH